MLGFVRLFDRFRKDRGNMAGIFTIACVPQISGIGAAIDRTDAFFAVLDSIAVQLRRLRADERGAVSAMMGLLMVALAGFIALGFEVSNWYLITRGMQNAADAATIAAAFNNSASYDVEARAVAAQYGFVNGANNVNVAVTNKAACPGGGNNCYSVSISGFTPLLLSQLVGFQGNGNINGAPQKQLSAAAVATPSGSPLCLLALATSGAPQGIRTNGAPFANMQGCSSLSNTAAQCNGHNLGLDVSYAVGSNNGCGNKQTQIPAPIADPFLSQITANIKAFSANNPCGGYPQEPGKKGPPLPASNQLSGSYNLNGNVFYCGDQQLTGNVTINTPGGSAVMIIENGQLDLNGFQFQTAKGAALTIVFTGSDCCGYIHAPTDNGHGGVLDITPPTTGPWAGMAIVQDPNLMTGVDISSAGNSPTWNITGLIYMPHATITLKGAIDKSTNGQSCVVMVADNFQISGTGGILKTNVQNCAAAGLAQPKSPGGAVLVQ
jgi:Flp pilus assembly protein TadG